MKKNILLIEDDNFFQKFYKTKLTDCGYQVDYAENGKIGMEKLKSQTFDLILLDLVMPQMDGFEVLKAKSEDTDLKKIPVIVFSTLGQDTDIEEAKKLGATDYMNKTFYNFETLLDKIKSLIS